VDAKLWEESLLKELDYYAARVPHHHLKSIFFGGGTPSLMSPHITNALIDRAKQLWTHDEDLEITLEANPGTVDTPKFQAFRDTGVNRLSLGVQSLYDEDLAFLGRKHSAKDALKAVEMAARIFDRYSFDLIYARPHQTPETWERELKEALTYAGDHLSLYQLTIEQGTAFYTKFNRGDFTLPDDEKGAELYELTDQIMTDAGRPRYETSNYARPGGESRHNLIYWHCEDYIGIGPGAHGRITTPEGRVATRGIKAPALWIEAVQGHGHGCQEEEVLTSDDNIQEFFMMGLRLTTGVDETVFQARFNKNFEDVLNVRGLSLLQQEGFLMREGSSLKAAPKGHLCLNQVLSHIL